MKQFISIGQIINSHGIHGELKVYPLTDDVRRFKSLKRVFIDNNEKKVVWCKFNNDKVILKIEGIETIEDALCLKNKYIDVLREDAVSLKEGTYYIADLIGCTVYDTDKKELGKISEVLQTGSNDVYWVKGNNGDLLVPALKSVVVSIDTEKEEVYIKPEVEWSWT